MISPRIVRYRKLRNSMLTMQHFQAHVPGGYNVSGWFPILCMMSAWSALGHTKLCGDLATVPIFPRRWVRLVGVNWSVVAPAKLMIRLKRCELLSNKVSFKGPANAHRPAEFRVSLL
ncbi:hypothetical protein MCOR03_007703, partial [Pyricularia oryzae]